MRLSHSSPFYRSSLRPVEVSENGRFWREVRGEDMVSCFMLGLNSGGDHAWKKTIKMHCNSYYKTYQEECGPVSTYFEHNPADSKADDSSNHECGPVRHFSTTVADMHSNSRVVIPIISDSEGDSANQSLQSPLQFVSPLKVSAPIEFVRKAGFTNNMGRPWPISILASLEDAGIIKCATSLFNNLQKEPDTVTWTVIIKSHLDFGLLVKLCCCVRLGELGVKVDSFTLPSINRAVSSLKRDSLLGKMVHCVAMKLGFGFDLYFCNTIIEEVLLVLDLFNKMRLGMEQNSVHFDCYVSRVLCMRGRSGRLKEALTITIKMEVFADKRIRGTLLAADLTNTWEIMGDLEGVLVSNHTKRSPNSRVLLRGFADLNASSPLKFLSQIGSPRKAKTYGGKESKDKTSSN
ncbi:hypothetical protein POTOM_051374 [Populus tomentosa]|uniref:Pentatricopeptide repeat-containing protein n=1 Tax=Populus tomentosa TaxID=118781 RepID=A0A8X7Y5X6_POPTO|nr:hypothetical protein POTOM_051374 [Populus tomentosa]